MSTMTLKMSESEGGAEFSKCRRSLGRALKVSAKSPVTPVLGGAAPVRGSTWELAPSPEVDVFVTPIRRRGTPRSGACRS